MSKPMPAWMVVFNRLTGMAILAGMGWLLYEFGDQWQGWIVALMIVAMLIAVVMVFAPDKMKLLFGFLKPVADGWGSMISKIGKDKIDPPAEPPK